MSTSPLVIKDSNQQEQHLSTVGDIAANLVMVHAPASVDSNGVASPVSLTKPLPVMNTAGSVAIAGDGTVISATSSQILFSGVVPVNGFQFANNCSSGMIWVSDSQTAATNVGMPVAVGAIYTTPSGYKPVGQVTIYGGATAGNFAARRW